MNLAAGVALAELLRYLTGWPRPLGPDDAAFLGVMVLIGWASDTYHLRRERTRMHGIIEDIRAELR